MPSTANSLDTGNINSSCNIANVIGVRAIANASSSSSGGPNHDNRDAHIYEIQAWANVSSYLDKGLYYAKGGAVKKIGVQALTGTHSLRFAKGGTTYGVPLLATSDPAACGIRIAKGGNVYSLPNGSYNPSTNLMTLAATTHSYSGGDGGTPGSNSIDGNFSTAYEAYTPNNISVVSSHTFSVPYTLTQISYRIYLNYYAYGDSGASGSASYQIQYTTDGTNWTTYASGSI